MIKDEYFANGYSVVNGINMYYEMHGDTGEYLVLLHGGGSTITTTFGSILPLLAKGFRVIAAELQAHGRTSDRDAPETFEQDADDVAMLLQNLGINKASFFGFSNGGSTALQIAIRHPDLVRKLVVASALYKRDGMPAGFFDGMATATIEDMPVFLKDAFLKVNNNQELLLNMFTKDRERMLQFSDWDDKDLTAINAPALIINGDRDVITCDHAMQISRLIKGSRLLILPSDHGSYVGEAGSAGERSGLYKVTATLVTSFLQEYVA